MSSLKLTLISQVLLLLLLLLLLENSWALSCLPCSDFKCRELLCPGGKVLGPCGCCYQCAKQKKESCGGPFRIAGECDLGLKCVTRGNFKGDIGVCEEKQLTDDNEFMVWLKAWLMRRRGKP
ncbi:cysteine-rich motor neuron 1 protein-like [Colossoma macropomum]|uniref:cysteine-rich motor neuron 1 protein-like n=1 Tax=Colossoma macropomum TaxID=42526 RepID=UPI001863DD7B|nr:cysteine-rich motor neuron 1 protein-like [Colossoma macropomum]